MDELENTLVDLTTRCILGVGDARYHSDNSMVFCYCLCHLLLKGGVGIMIQVTQNSRGWIVGGLPVKDGDMECLETFRANNSKEIRSPVVKRRAIFSR